MGKPATLEDVLAEVRALRIELAAERAQRKKAKRSGAKRARTVAMRVASVAGVVADDVQVAKVKRAIRERMGRL